MGAALLQQYEKLGRRLRITGAFGDARVRGGSSVAVCLKLGDLNLNSWMAVEKAVHCWEGGSYTMELTLIGHKGEFRA